MMGQPDTQADTHTNTRLDMIALDQANSKVSMKGHAVPLVSMKGHAVPLISMKGHAVPLIASEQVSSKVSMMRQQDTQTDLIALDRAATPDLIA